MPPPQGDPTAGATTAASQLAGFISILCWLLVFTPQLWQNYTKKSTDGLSVTFIIVWLFGDVCSFAGAWMHRLLPTMIGLSVYYAVVELLLLYQVWLYSTGSSSSRHAEDVTLPPTEESPLLASPPSSPTMKATTTRLCLVAASLLVVDVWSRGDGGSGGGNNVNDHRAWSSPSEGAAVAAVWSAPMIADVLGYVSAAAYGMEAP
ncbi:hypothetical protein HDU86_002560 [Geranomyces michiganensis]|nr:hypothetical protein HDU86_002560 [Geranomyces michiganensis]